MWNFEVIKDWGTIESKEFQSWWNNLASISATRHVFFTPAIANIWIKTYNPLRNLKPLFIKGSDNTGNEVLFPLVIWHRNWKNAFMRTIIPIGYSDYDYHDPLFRALPNSKSVAAFWGEIIQLLSIEKADEINIDGIRDNLLPQNKLNWSQCEICPNLDISKMHSGDDLMLFFKTKLRGDIRRQIRRMEELGELEFNIFESYDKIPKDLIESFLMAHSRRWPNAYKAPGFHDNLLRIVGIDGPVHFSTLNINGKPIAWHLGFKHDGKFYYYMPAGDSSYQKYSPVKVHLYFLVKRAIEDGLCLYDHLRGDENYKSGWANSYVYVNEYSNSNLPSSSKLKKALLKLRKSISH